MKKYNFLGETMISFHPDESLYLGYEVIEVSSSDTADFYYGLRSYLKRIVPKDTIVFSDEITGISESIDDVVSIGKSLLYHEVLPVHLAESVDYFYDLKENEL